MREKKTDRQRCRLHKERQTEKHKNRQIDKMKEGGGEKHGYQSE